MSSMVECNWSMVECNWSMVECNSNMVECNSNMVECNSSMVEWHYWHNVIQVWYNVDQYGLVNNKWCVMIYEEMHQLDITLPGIIKWCYLDSCNINISMSLTKHRDLATFTTSWCIPHYNHLENNTCQSMKDIKYTCIFSFYLFSLPVYHGYLYHIHTTLHHYLRN